MNTFPTTAARPSHMGRRGLIAFVTGICILAIPATAVANYGAVPSSGNSSAGDNIARNAGFVAPDHTALNESLAPASGSNGGSSVNAPPATTPVSSSPATGDSFDWADAALGAGVVMALGTLGGLALITLRRRTAVTPSASAG